MVHSGGKRRRPCRLRAAPLIAVVLWDLGMDAPLATRARCSGEPVPWAASAKAGQGNTSNLQWAIHREKAEESLGFNDLKEYHSPSLDLYKFRSLALR